MIPVLVGVGKLYDTLSCAVSEELNGNYYLELVYPADGEFINDLYEGGAIAVICPTWTVETVGGSQTFKNALDFEIFDIYSSELSIDGTVKFRANHRSRLLSGRTYWLSRIYGDITEMLTYTIPTTTVQAYGDADAARSFTPKDWPKSLLSCIIGSDDSLASTWGYEFAFSSRATSGVRVWQFLHRGENRGARIIYGVNLTDLNYTRDKLGAFNAILPWAATSDGGRLMPTSGGRPYYIQPTNPPAEPVVCAVMDFTAEFNGDEPTEAELVTMARNYLDSKRPWIAAKTIKADFINGAEIDQHAAEVWLGDTVSVEWPTAKVREQMRVMGYEYDVLSETYAKMTLGTLQTEFVAVTGDVGGASAPTGGGSGADYVIEEGTSGIWNYRKWASGLAECFGIGAHALTLSTVWTAPIYYNSGGAISDALPNGLFTSVNECIYSISGASSSGADCWPCLASAQPLSTSQTCGIYLLRVGASGTQRTFNISWHVIGRWT